MGKYDQGYKKAENKTDRFLIKVVKSRFTLVIVAAAIAALLTFGIMTGSVVAHPGGMSPKDNCHKSKALQERHWHQEGTAKRGGVCKDGVQVGNCQAVVNEYMKVRKYRFSSYKDEALAARKAADCLLEASNS